MRSRYDLIADWIVGLEPNQPKIAFFGNTKPVKTKVWDIKPPLEPRAPIKPRIKRPR